jgi:glycosyltransferase involved in cell wall biosynthesis
MGSIQKITFCIPSKTNLRYLKTALPSIRKNAYRKDHDIIVFVDSDEDGTLEWLKENAESYGVKYYVNPDLGNSLYGIGRAYDYCIDKAETSIVMIFHADMMLGKDADYHAIKHLKPLSVVCSTRIEPPLHPNGGEKILEDFGMYPEEFKESEFDSYVDTLLIENAGKTTEGIFAPWMVYKEDIQSIGGHDPIMHSCREDSDLFNRFVMNGYQLIQSWDSLVYHLTGRGAGSFDGDSERHEKWKRDMNNSTKEFIRKWGSNVKHDKMMKPIITHKYDIEFNVVNCNLQIIGILEPWCSRMTTDCSQDIIDEYIKLEQPNTQFDLTNRFNTIGKSDVVVSFDARSLTQNSFNFIQNLSEIFDFNEFESGQYEFDIFNIKVNRVKHYERDLINL